MIKLSLNFRYHGNLDLLTLKMIKSIHNLKPEDYE